MTVNELEQAIRNLIASQPVVSAGANGDAINSSLSIIYSFREFMFKVQGHPFQDALKINLINSSRNLENDIVISVCQILQERGINIMLYAPSNRFGAGISQSPYQSASFAPTNIGVQQTNEYLQTEQQKNIYQNQTANIYNNLDKIDGEPLENKYNNSSEVPLQNNNLSNNEFENKIYEQNILKNEANNFGGNSRKFEEIKSNTRSEAIKQQKAQTPPEKCAGRDYLLELLKK